MIYCQIRAVFGVYLEPQGTCCLPWTTRYPWPADIVSFTAHHSQPKSKTMPRHKIDNVALNSRGVSSGRVCDHRATRLEGGNFARSPKSFSQTGQYPEHSRKWAIIGVSALTHNGSDLWRWSPKPPCTSSNVACLRNLIWILRFFFYL